jgi:glycosyltransferase involved in cell wall biosynthesis
MSVADRTSLLRTFGPACGEASKKGTIATTSQIKLLKFVALFGFGGTERQFVNLARTIDRSRFDLRFACLARWGHFLEEIEQQRIPVAEYHIDSLRNLTALKQQWKLAGDIRRNGIEIIHAYNFYANVFAVPAAKLAGAPVVIASIRDMGACLTPAQRRVQKFVAGLADCILVNADAIRQRLIAHGYPGGKMSVIRNGIDLSRYVPGKSGTGLRREFGLPSRAPLVVMLSRLNPQKGVDDFLNAAARVREQFPRARFLVVGEKFIQQDGVRQRDVAYRQELARRAAGLGLGGRIAFTGFRSDVPAVLSEAAVSVLPSLSEGLSNTLLESMAAGVPVVATRVGGNPEVIEDGVSGILVSPRDPAALAQAVCAILQDRDLARRLACSARQRVVEHFALKRMARETEDLYVELLERKANGRRRMNRNSRN